MKILLIVSFIHFVIHSLYLLIYSSIHSNQMFALCCRVKTDFIARRNKINSLWTMSSHLANHVVDFLKEIYILRSKCSNKVNWDLTCLIIAYLFHYHSFGSSSFICLIIIHLFHHHSFVSLLFICFILIHLFQYHSLVSFICLIHLFQQNSSRGALFKNNKNENENENEWLFVEKLINISIISWLLTNHNTKKDFNLFFLIL